MQVYGTVIDGVLLAVPGTDAGPARPEPDPSAFRWTSRVRSTRGAVYGLHGRAGDGESRSMSCAAGAVLAVVVDARPRSPMFSRVATFLLDDSDGRVLHVPAGCLHGFQALTASVDVRYRMDAPPDPAQRVSVRVDDPDLAVRLPCPTPGPAAPGPTAPAGSWAELCARLGADVPERRSPVGW